MPADLTNPFSESCCDGGACSSAESARPCGCDYGAKHWCAAHAWKEHIKNLIDWYESSTAYGEFYEDLLQDLKEMVNE